MRLELKEFAKAVHSMHQQQPGGVKRTRLMLHLRPYKTRKIFLLKATDGRTTLTTRVEHQGQIKLVEALIGDFVTDCTRLSVPTASAAAATTTTAAAAAAGAQSPPAATSGNHNNHHHGVASAAEASSPSKAAQKEGAGQPQHPQQHKGSQGGGASSPHQQQKGGRSTNKAKKGKKH